jgi:hypothetical protein
MGFLNTELSHATDELGAWLNEQKGGRITSVERKEVEGDLEAVLKSLIPLSKGMSSKKLLIPTIGEWVCYLDNVRRGTDSSAIRYLARRLSCRTVWVVARPHTYKKEGKIWSGRQGALILEVFSPEDTDWLNLIRSIRLVNDAGKWEFELTGDPLPYEMVENYKARKKTDHFTFEIMCNYLEEMAIRPFDESFYLPAEKDHAVLFDLIGPGKDIEHISLERARQMAGIHEISKI